MICSLRLITGHVHTGHKKRRLHEGDTLIFNYRMSEDEDTSEYEAIQVDKASSFPYQKINKIQKNRDPRIRKIQDLNHGATIYQIEIMRTPHNLQPTRNITSKSSIQIGIELEVVNLIQQASPRHSFRFV